ncbi:MAG: prevent-host-death protein [Burkholderiales bacterium PBB3]|nr:MAG: prevent-host-death protein [Burkholderiales bacterium PBB3]
MQVTATEAKNRFGYVCAQAKTEPVFVEKDGRVESVILSFQDYEVLTAARAKDSLAARQKAFNENHKAWIEAQNTRFEKHGLWCDDLRVW